MSQERACGHCKKLTVMKQGQRFCCASCRAKNHQEESRTLLRELLECLDTGQPLSERAQACVLRARKFLK
jgi:hypothetical protein